MMPNLKVPALTCAASAPSASRAEATAYWLMGLLLRSRGCARKAGRGFGTGTCRTSNGRSQPGRANSLVGITCPELRRSEEHTSELQSQSNLVCRLLLEKKKKKQKENN